MVMTGGVVVVVVGVTTTGGVLVTMTLGVVTGGELDVKGGGGT